jgi:predicted AAA+ superfamily ATPase
MSSSYAAEVDTTIGNRPQWQWITRRSIEPTIEKWLHISSSVVLIRGQRRSGKSSTLKTCAKKLNKKSLNYLSEMIQ